MSWMNSGTAQEDESNDDMYNYSFNVNPSAMPGTSSGVNQFTAGGMTGRAPGTSMGGARVLASRGARLMTGQASRMGTAAGGGRGGAGTHRPMTSVTDTGYSRNKPKHFDPLNQGRGAAPPLEDKSANSPEDLAREMERTVNGLIEKSAFEASKGNLREALDHAKEAGSKERLLCRHRESKGLIDQINVDLTYAVCFNLATVLHKNKLYDEALHTYSLLVKNKQYPQSGRLRVNMGNIYYEQRKWPNAIKMYRMALDQIPNTGKEIRSKIFRNIGNAFVRMGQFQDAIQSYETIMSGNPDMQTGFNLILCYYGLGDAEKMRRGFSRMLTIPIQGLTEEDEEPEEVKAMEDMEAAGTAEVDALRQELKRRQKDAHQYILTAARLITPVLEKSDFVSGYQWAIDQLKHDHEHLASELQIELALMHLKNKQFDKAIEGLKTFEKKDQQHRAMAATNLSFIYFLEQDYTQAEKYADLAYTHDRYNAKALVNKGNCLMVRGELDMAKQFYLEAIGVEADCVEAIYNLGLVNLRMGSLPEAQQAFEKLHTIIPHNPEVIYQIATLHEQGGNMHHAVKWFNILSTRVPSDPGVLARMGQIYNHEDDESQAFHFYLESYRHYPVSLDVISWLGVWYVKQELYEKAIHFFERASQIQPGEVKWRLMVTSCYRRMQNFQMALELYEQIHADHPENLECLRYLVAICKDLDRPYDVYQQKLARLDRTSNQQSRPGGALTRVNPDQSQQQQQQQQQQQRSQYSQQQAHHGGGGALGRVQEEPSHRPLSGRERLTTEPSQTPQKDPEDDEFGDADIDELLPGM